MNNVNVDPDGVDPIENANIDIDPDVSHIENGSNAIAVSSIRKNDIIRFKRTGDSAWENGKVISRAGKAGGKYDTWWNLKNVDTGHIKAEDLGSTETIEKMKEVVSEEEQVLVMTLPRHLHNEKRCKDAKQKELTSWDDFDVYEEIQDEGQPRLGTNWVLTEKIIDGHHGVKARLTVRGDQEDTENVRKDSPTVRKGNIKIFCAVAAKEGWDIKTNDVTCAFLQGAPIKRHVYILPPKERRVPGILWKLKKPVYGLTDAARGWHLALDGELTGSGCDKCLIDPAMYLYFSEKGKKTIEGIALTHVDDVLHGGTDKFEEEVMKTVKSSFKFSSEESEQFRYVGMNMFQRDNGILINQDHYVHSLELPDMEIARGQKSDEELNAEGQTEFRACVAKILYVGFQSRPDVCFEGKCLSTKFGKATKSDLKCALKKIQKLKGNNTEMFFPNLGYVGDWCIVGYSDAGIRSMPDKTNSVGGQVVLLVNERKKLACIMNWRSKKLVRKVVSSLAGEALAMVAVIGEIVYNKAILSQIYGDVIGNLPVVVVIDSKNLYESILSTSLVEDSWLIPDIAIIKEALQQETISSVRRVSSEDMLANCLTKAGASAEGLLHVLRTGNFELPVGIDT